MTRFVLIDRGEELSGENSRKVFSGSAPVRVRLLEAAPPFREWQILEVAPGSERRARGRDFFLCRSGSTLSLRWLREAPIPEAEEVLGRVVAVERGGVAFPLERGLLARVPPAWLLRAIDALEILDRLRHPLTPSLYLGTPEACLAGVRDKYDREGEAREYAKLALTGLDSLERDIVDRHVKPGGRILDIGCGAGREALGFARAGFRVVGIDVAPRMIELAHANALREGLDITFRVQSVTEIDHPPGSFDGAFWVGSYYHVPGRALRVESLGRIANSLAPDGTLVLAVPYRGRLGLLSRSRLVDLLRAIAVRIVRKGKLSEPGDRFSGEVSPVSDPRGPCFFHDFSGPAEVRAEIEAAGLSAEEVSPGWWVSHRALP